MGNDIITNFKTDDILTLSKGQTAATATKVSETHYKVTINSGKKAVGTLDITGLSAFTTNAESTTSYKGTGDDSDTTYYDVTSYVNIGGNKVAYNVATKVTKVEAAYEERFDNELFKDTLIADSNDLNEISAITDNNYSIATKYITSTEFDSYNNKQSNILTTNKKKE